MRRQASCRIITVHAVLPSRCRDADPKRHETKRHLTDCLASVADFFQVAYVQEGHDVPDQILREAVKVPRLLRPCRRLPPTPTGHAPPPLRRDLLALPAGRGSHHFFNPPLTVLRGATMQWYLDRYSATGLISYGDHEVYVSEPVGRLGWRTWIVDSISDSWIRL